MFIEPLKATDFIRIKCSDPMVGKYFAHSGDNIHAEWWEHLSIWCNGKYKYTKKISVVGQTDMILVKGSWTLSGDTLMLIPNKVKLWPVNGIIDSKRKQNLVKKKTRYLESSKLLRRLSGYGRFEKQN